MNPITLSTGGVLDDLEPWRADEFAAHMERAREHIRPWVGPAFLSTDVDGARRTLQRYAEGRAQDSRRIYGIWSEGVLVGGAMFVDFSAATGICEIGCWSEPAGEGRGHITAAVTELVRYAFEVRGLHRAEWRCRSDNDRSIAVARRLGMTFEGELRQAWTVDGIRYDKAVWSLLATDPGWRDRAR